MPLVRVVVITLIMVIVLLVVMLFGDSAITLYPIKASAKIECCKTKVIRSEKAQCGLGRVNRGHKGLFTDNRHFLLSIVQHQSTDVLAGTQV